MYMSIPLTPLHKHSHFLNTHTTLCQKNTYYTRTFYKSLCMDLLTSPHLTSPHLILLRFSSISSSRVPDAITETPPYTESFLTDSHASHPDPDPLLPHHRDVTQKSKVMSAYHMSYWDAEDRAAVERTAAQLAALSTSLKDQAFR